MTQRALFQVIVRAIGLWLVVLGIRSFIQDGILVTSGFPGALTPGIAIELVWIQLHRAAPEFLIGLYLLCGGRTLVNFCFPERSTDDIPPGNTALELHLPARKQFQVAVRVVGLWLVAIGIRSLVAAAYAIVAHPPFQSLSVFSIATDDVGLHLRAAAPEILIGLYLLNGAPWLVERCFPNKPPAE